MATPQYAMAQSGDRSMILANIFSDSLYSNECSKAMAILKSFLRLSGTEAVKETEPNISPSCGPHETISPLFKSSEFTSARWVAVLSWHEKSVGRNKNAQMTVKVERCISMV